VAWYKVSASLDPDESCFAIHRSLNQHYDIPYLVLFNQDSISKSYLAIKSFELVNATSEDLEPLEVPFTLEVGEAERIGVDDIVKSESDKSQTVVASHLSTEKSAIEMFSQRLKVVSTYVDLVQNQALAPDYDILRQISSFVSKLNYDNSMLKDALDEQKLTVLSEALLALTTKGSYIGLDLAAKKSVYGI
jgi:hypothetical protein